MLFTGYHGTTVENASKIIKTKKFLISNGDTEWLGKGIYFYPDINDAYNWRECETILHTVIKVNEDEYLDIDTKEGKDIYNIVTDFLLSMSISDKELSSPQKNQCAIMNLIWDTYDKVKIISASFATERTKLKTLIDTRPTRKEFCVRSNDNIVLIQEIRKGDLGD